ncbi:hypothetical protein [Gordonia amicalis]|uniref:hypothetical protein n=1 Tax=Gordonia amicalis TaxID=89053 RepID=UPI0015F3979D|nr:hypothetical protein [Gordonia amicalis]MBA5849266.1 hypothetical protein [Gordonia amicalis]
MTWLRRLGPVWCLALSVAAAFAAVWIQGRLYAACEPQTGPGPADGPYVWFFVIPATAVGALAASSAGYILTMRARTPVSYLAPAVALVAACLVVWGAVAWNYDPDAMTEIWCNGGKPDWWPSWLPL